MCVPLTLQSVCFNSFKRATIKLACIWLNLATVKDMGIHAPNSTDMNTGNARISLYFIGKFSSSLVNNLK